MKSLPTILLFDIDGTLITTGGAGQRALERAFAQRCGDGDWLGFRLAGMTDPAIVRTALGRGGRPDDDETVEAVLEQYVAFLSEEIANTAHYAVHPGIAEAIDRVATRTDSYALGLGTGNLERGAQIKLARGGLDQHFAFGGFGSDHEDRAEVLRIGAERGAQQLGRSPEQCRIVVIGDTPKDVAAARAIDATCVAVGTGSYSSDELRAAGATAAFDDLSQHGALEAVLGD